MSSQIFIEVLLKICHVCVIGLMSLVQKSQFLGVEKKWARSGVLHTD